MLEKKPLTAQQKMLLMETLETRFAQNPHRHKGLAWADVLAKLQENGTGLNALFEMERTGGQPDVIGREEETGAFMFCDCSSESPAARRSLCYDDEALEARAKNKPAGSAVGLAAAMGVELLTEQHYRALQQLGEFDLKTSSWVATPQDVRRLGGALFCDRRYGRVFVYHNGADSYYGVRGFRAWLRVTSK